MGGSRGNQPRVVASLTLAAFVALLGLVLRNPNWRPGAILLHNSYDSLHSFGGIHAEITANSPVVLV